MDISVNAVPERNPDAGLIQHTNTTTFVQWISVILSVHFEVTNRSQKFPNIGLSLLKDFVYSVSVGGATGNDRHPIHFICMV